MCTFTTTDSPDDVLSQINAKYRTNLVLEHLLLTCGPEDIAELPEIAEYLGLRHWSNLHRHEQLALPLPRTLEDFGKLGPSTSVTLFFQNYWHQVHSPLTEYLNGTRKKGLRQELKRLETLTELVTELGREARWDRLYSLLDYLPDIEFYRCLIESTIESRPSTAGAPRSRLFLDRLILDLLAVPMVPSGDLCPEVLWNIGVDEVMEKVNAEPATAFIDKQEFLEAARHMRTEPSGRGFKWLTLFMRTQMSTRLIPFLTHREVARLLIVTEAEPRRHLDENGRVSEDPDLPLECIEDAAIRL